MAVSIMLMLDRAKTVLSLPQTLGCLYERARSDPFEYTDLAASQPILGWFDQSHAGAVSHYKV